MKAQELMIGDWVRCDGEPYRIAEIGGMACLDYKRELFAALEDIEPIPLTPEILEKSGLGRNGYYGIYDEYFDLTIKEVSDGLWVFRYECTEMGGVPFTQSVVSFVHELQQELRKHCIDVEVKL